MQSTNALLRALRVAAILVPLLRPTVAPAGPAATAPAPSCVTSECHADLAPAEKLHTARGITCAGCHSNVTDGKADHEDALDGLPPEKLCGQSGCHTKQAEGTLSSAHKDAVCESCHGTSHGNELKPANYGACKDCHKESVEPFSQAVHAKADRPVGCGDCHGDTHAVKRKNDPQAPMARARQSDTCGKCHEKIARDYAASAHGSAAARGSGDVPVCTDCHAAHKMGGAKTMSFHLSTPDLCARCHADTKRMERYGLSTDVLRTYLADFHGMTASFQRMEGSTVDRSKVAATCVDCHGVHDIARTSRGAGAAATDQVRANAVEMCRKCHPDATENFPAAWLSHYEPSLENASLVYGVKIFYRFFIPFVIGGLVLQILLSLWRFLVKR